MKKALLTKLTLLFTVLAIAFYAIAFVGIGKVSAAVTDISSINIASFFDGVDKNDVSFDEDNGNLKVTVGSDAEFSFVEKLVADDLEISLSVPNVVTKFTVTLSSDEYVDNGGEVSNVLTVDIAGAKISLNDETKEENIEAGEFTIGFTVTGDVLKAKVGDAVIENGADDFAKMLAGKDKHPVSIVFSFTLAEDTESADVIFKYVDQNASAEGYKQTFKLNEDGKVETIAKPRVSMTTLPLNIKDGKLVPVKDYKYTFAFTAYSLFGSVDGSNVYFAKTNEFMKLENKDKPKTVVFTNDEINEIYLCTDSINELEKYSVAPAALRESDEQAPAYLDKDEYAPLYDGYRELVEKASKADYDGEEYSIRLGEEYKIPSLEKLVTDDLDTYSALTYTVYYRTPSSSTGSTSSMSFTVSEAGDYLFYVVFKDKNGNAMDKDEFITEDENDNEMIAEDAVVFTFSVQDDAPLSVKARSQGDGYVGTKYTANDFEIKASDKNVTYTLKYNSDVNAKVDSDGWVEIPEGTDEVNYDGKYTFTPDKIGAYMIECVATSVTNVRIASDSAIIRVYEKKTEVKPDTHWLQNNVWSVVFLSIGTLALIGIIVLLFIKPKDAPETDATGDALNSKK